ncbi:uncharacterized protein LOC121186281 [Toxotes jaculatrix]|uniref:uncharacterized protein LOC121186281 n=1 Tax=Toxotes jaculatrix TaxID=941984 RepID=UPI001B3B1575|nr:uncharacterized protein LOC121186281 [Toxotes jaculatrix]
MKFFVCCLLLLPFATTVLTAPVRDALGTMTIPTNATAHGNPPSKPVTEKDSEDMSDEKSEESFDPNGFTDAGKALESHEIKIMIPKVVVNDNAPGRKTGVDEDSVEPVDTSRRTMVQDQGSTERTDLDSEEGMDGNLSGKQVIRLSGDKMTDSAGQGANLQRRAGRVNGLNGMLAPGQSREMLDWDSLEDNNGRPAAVGSIRDQGYDETREYISSETYPIAPPENRPSHLSVPPKSQAPR